MRHEVPDGAVHEDRGRGERDDEQHQPRRLLAERGRVRRDVLPPVQRRLLTVGGERLLDHGR